MRLPVERDKIPLHIMSNTVILERSGKFLIIKRRPDEVAFPGKWEFIGGKLEHRESVILSLCREVFEETGLETDGGFMFLSDYEFTRRDGYHVVGLRFLAHAKPGKIKLSSDHTEYAWITPSDAAKYDLIKGLNKELKQAANMLNKKR